MRVSVRINMIKKILVRIFVLILIIVPAFAFAQVEIPPTTSSSGIITIHNPFNCNKIPETNCTFIDLLTSILENVVMPIVSVVVVIWIIWAGFTYVMAQGNEPEIRKAHQRLLWSLIGAGVLLGAEAISKVVQSTVSSLITH